MGEVLGEMLYARHGTAPTHGLPAGSVPAQEDARQVSFTAGHQQVTDREEEETENTKVRGGLQSVGGSGKGNWRWYDRNISKDK